MGELVKREPLPKEVIDRIFTRMLVRYGYAWLRQWGELEIGAIKTDWSIELAGASEESITYGLNNLPGDKPPATAIAFRDLCNRRPIYSKRQKDPRAHFDPEKLAAAKAALAATLTAKKKAHDWSRVDLTKATLTAKDMARNGQRSQPTNIIGDFKPIEDYRLPPAMRADAHTRIQETDHG